MKKIWMILLLLAVLISTPAHAKKLNIVCTTGQITDLVKQVAGDQANVVGLMGAGVDPHLYKASESDVRALAKADIIFYNGLFLEAKMASVFEKMKNNKIVVALGETLTPSILLDNTTYTGQYDPHIWFDVTLWQNVLESITETLMDADPENALAYDAASEELRSRLELLDDYLKRRSHQLTKEERVLITAHDAFRYFGRRYDFEVLGLQGLSTEAEAGTNDVMRLVNIIVERKIPAIFVESSVPERNIKAVQEAAQAKGWNVVVGGELYSDAVGEDGSYIHMVTHNIDTIIKALKPDAVDLPMEVVNEAEEEDGDE